MPSTGIWGQKSDKVSFKFGKTTMKESMEETLLGKMLDENYELKIMKRRVVLQQVGFQGDLG